MSKKIFQSPLCVSGLGKAFARFHASCFVLCVEIASQQNTMAALETLLVLLLSWLRVRIVTFHRLTRLLVQVSSSVRQHSLP